MLMADLGADVIKIEVPEGGDSSRRMTVLPGMPSTFFETNNRGVWREPTSSARTSGAVLPRRTASATRNCAGSTRSLSMFRSRATAPTVPMATQPGTDSMAQALGGVAEAYSTRGLPMSTGIASVADESCAMLAFGGALAALTHARTTGQGQKVELSLLGAVIRLMGWTFTTTMWRNQNPVTGQARITGTAQRPGISASFNDRDGKPLVFQLTGPKNWSNAMAALGFVERVKAAGFKHLGVIIDNDAKRVELLALLDQLFATGSREDWVARLRGADIVSAPTNTLLEASNDPDVLANGYVTEIDYPKHGKRLKVHGTPWRFSETPASPIAPELGEHNDGVLASLGHTAAEIADFRKRKII
jgi:crotonobetainyl-CoA:carnitine CoA-transferase CaiB-like acyl-CoA transferase